MANNVPSQYVATIQSSAAANGVSPSLLASLLNHESGFNYQAVNHNYVNGQVASTDRGIAQINNVAYPQVTDAQANDPYYAIPYAAQILGNHIKNCGSVAGGLAAYNSGQCSGDSAYSTAVLAGQSNYAGLNSGLSGFASQLFGGGSSDWTRIGLIAIVVVFGFLFIYKGLE